ncbi:putative Histidine kinase [Planktothrix serta PCC 8927]|uniref:histidine kinase n=1 Tax=Planktothrix serta PCC 8927 TaxID=671068 RepID=A0A7Z9BP90_9CYAN|nr:sensor histidine kinase [Planktothrix serta]VXD15475.1 putative Histidine kinase [Planktothrix serta PCC 8927]
MAIKYSPKSGIIKLEIMQDFQQIILQVQDRGIGIPEAEQAKVFDRFYRGSNIGNISGTGLDLAQVKGFVEAHWENISIHSKLGSETQFTVQLSRIPDIKDYTIITKLQKHPLNSKKY